MDGFATVRKKIRFFFYTRRGGEREAVNRVHISREL